MVHGFRRAAPAPISYDENTLIYNPWDAMTCVEVAAGLVMFFRQSLQAAVKTH